MAGLLRRFSIAAVFVLCAPVAAAMFAAPADSAPDPSLVPPAIAILPSLKTVESVGRFATGVSGWDDKALYAAYRAALKQGVPAKTIEFDTWMGDANNVEGIAHLVHWSGGDVVWAWRCMPHDCSDNQVDTIYDPKTHQAWGVARLEKDVLVYGNPSIRQKALLVALYASRSANTANDLTFPIAANDRPQAEKNVRNSRGNFAAFFPL